uniref:NADH dehydrogenase subunit 4L n=1 Tax=Limnocentropus hysbald TaxID=1875661 RepID=UPI0022DCE03E|nr:NADH dehydrogenase subunit 4L [Limnocentropus hysbald]UZZ44126.1 NADH dehydrogenase subunit 4L [Limnocentropus hysbald]
MKVFNLSIFFILSFFMGNIIFSSNRKHLLIILLSLEFIMLNIFLFLFMYLMMLMNNYYFLMLFLVISVCEGVLGVSILVYMTRIYGNDYFQVFNLL